jgi:2-polyprenyl-3-methyl-5-hydroxy-6-metoxy-1,4-benzoquinol methylase
MTIMEGAPIECIICGGRQRKDLVTINGWTVKSCMQCGFGVLDPRPSVADIVKLYDEQYCHDRFEDGGEPGTQKFTHRLSLESSRLRLIKSGKNRGSVLDIGCGFGYFLAACRDNGYQIHGIDFSGFSVNHAITKLKIPVTIGALDEIDIAADQFDIITMWHSLEHMPYPDQAIIKATKWLKKGGILVVDVPNHESTDAIKYGLQWTGWDLPYHLSHFTSATLASMLENNGFTIIKRKNYHSEFIKEKLEKHMLINPFARLIAQLYSGHSIAMVARKY